jgi:hypothetical protein
VEDILAIVLLFGGGSVFLFSVSPIGRAIADRIRNSGRVEAGSVEPRLLEVMEDVDHLRSDVADVLERLDFMERVIARKQEQPRLPAEGEDF